MISAYSKNFDKHQLNYSVTDKELLAVVKGIDNYRHYLLGQEFLLKTDHKALVYLWESINPTSRLMRWSFKLQEYKFCVEHIKGEENAADGYSRINFIKRTIGKKKEYTVDEREKILNEYHTVLGHGSPNNMKAAIRNRYFWEEMFEDIDKFCKNCLICKKDGNQIPNTRNKVIVTNHPYELWEIDLIGRIVDKGKNKFIIVAIDHNSKLIETRVIGNKSGYEIVKFIQEQIIDKHGIPKRILSDCGLEFENALITNISNKYDFIWKFSSPYHHQTTGSVERVNQTLMNKLRKLTNFGRETQTRYVEAATLAVNLSFNRAIGTSPFIYMKGRLPELNVDKELNQPRVYISKTKIKNKRQAIFSRYKNEITKGKVIARSDFQIGEKVLIFRNPKINLKQIGMRGIK